MRLFLAFLVLALSLAGCTEGDKGGPVAPGPEAPPSAPLRPEAGDLRHIADAEAAQWNPAARLVLIAAFQGDELASTATDSPWVSPYIGDVADLAEGRSKVWSFSYTLDDEVSDAALMVCDQGVHAEVREAHVVTVNESGQVIASYETRNDDDGSTTTGFLPETIVDSAQAADIVWESLSDEFRGATRIRLFLMSEWYWPGPTWVFQVDTESEGVTLGVDAITGEFRTSPPSPRC